jgi:hypothetical protein
VTTFFVENIVVEGITSSTSKTVSIKGTFISNSRIRVSTFHFHHPVLRDLASYVGLALVALYWIPVLRSYLAKRR